MQKCNNKLKVWGPREGLAKCGHMLALRGPLRLLKIRMGSRGRLMLLTSFVKIGLGSSGIIGMCSFATECNWSFTNFLDGIVGECLAVFMLGIPDRFRSTVLETYHIMFPSFHIISTVE
jgi:hypothetical protein